MVPFIILNSNKTQPLFHYFRGGCRDYHQSYE